METAAQLTKIIENKMIKKSRVKTVHKGLDKVPNCTSLISPTVVDSILKAGILAPSGDNAQPWKFKVNGNTIGIYLNKSSDNSLFNVNQMASLISCGAVLENVRIAARQQQLSTSIIYPISKLDATKVIEEVIQLHLENDTADKTPDMLSFFIKERHTNRTKYTKKQIPENDLLQIKKSIVGFENVQLQLITDTAQKSKVAELVYKADIIRTENKDLHEYLMKMIRFSDEEALKTHDGFHVKNLEAGKAGELFLKLTKPWKRMNALNKIGMSKMIAKVSKQGINESAAIGLIKTKGHTIASIINAGRAMERIWLTATSLGIDFQPMTAVTLFYMRYLYGQKDAFSDKHQLVFEKMWNEYRNIFNAEPEETHIMLFRIGYGKHVKVKTLRKDVAAFMI